MKLPQINEKDKYMMDGDIQLEEIHIALKQMKKNKCPGLDGLTPEFYLRFWPYLAKAFHKLFTDIVKNNLLHTTARDSIFSLLDKPDKNPLHVKNWRPLTLLNTDYKIFAKVLANRMLQVLPYIVSQDQFGYLKGRSISDNLLDLMSVIQHCEDNQLEAILISVDFKRAYDSVSHKALLEILKAFNFGDNFIKMVMLCYKDIRGAVMNNNEWSEWIYPKVGLKQGCVLSCYLFILVTSVINYRINQNDNIKGICIGQKCKKSNQYVDDLWNAIRFELSSFQELLFEYSEFEDFTGLKINYDKTEILRIGSLFKTDAKFYSDLPLKWSDGPVSILGIKVHPKYLESVRINYDELLLKVENLFKIWNTRSLTPIGKILVVNTLCNSQFVYRLQCLPTPSRDFFDTYDKLIKHFIWDNKKAKIKFDRLTASYKEGGLQLRKLKYVDTSLKIAKMQTIKENKYFWTEFFHNQFKTQIIPPYEWNVSARDVKKIFPPSFFRDILSCWAQLNYHSPMDTTDILKQYLWYNSHIRQAGGWIYHTALAENNIYKISHIYNLDYGRFDTYQEFVDNNGKIIDFVTYHGIVKSIPKRWIDILKQNQGERKDKSPLWSKKFFDTKIKKSKFVYAFVRDNTSISNDALITIWNNDLKLSLTQQDFNRLFIYAKTLSISTKLWYFQYRTLCKKILTNVYFAKFDPNTNENCTFCSLEKETILHLFYSCTKVKQIWKALKRWVKHFYSLEITFSAANILLLRYKGRMSKLINTLFLITRFYIYRCKAQNSRLNFSDLAVDFVRHKNIEKHIAYKNDKLYRYARKWDDFSVFQQ